MDKIDCIWHRLRRPFRYPQAGHACHWERYDADRAGCVKCGALHRCSGSMIGCQCPLAEADDGGHVCLITGMCVPEVRTSCTEFADCVVFESQEQEFSCEDAGVLERAQAVIHAFLTSCGTAHCLRQEQEKGAQKLRQAFWRALKRRKKEEPHRLPCVCSVVAEVAQSEFAPSLPEESPLSLEQMVQRCASSVACCILQIHRMGFRKACQGGKFRGMVIGMLYLSRTGLRVGELFHMPAIPGIRALLPSETYLNSLGVSNKVICDTENEIKSCIRAFVDSRAEGRKRGPRRRPASVSSARSAPQAPSLSQARPWKARGSGAGARPPSCAPRSSAHAAGPPCR